MTDFEKADELNRMLAKDSVHKLLEVSAEFEPRDIMPSGLISEALTNRKRKNNPLLPLIFVGAATVALIAFFLANYRKEPAIALIAKNSDSLKTHGKPSSISENEEGGQSSMYDSLSFKNIVLEQYIEPHSKKTVSARLTRHNLKRRRSSATYRSSSNFELRDSKAPAKTYAAMWKTETIEQNYSGILATALVATQDEQDRKDGTFTVTPAIIDLPLNPGDTITTIEETSAVPGSTLNCKEDNP